MKKTVLILNCICYFFFLSACLGNEESEQWARRPMIMVENEIYMDTGRQVLIEVDDSEILGTITSSVDVTDIPTQNGESNFGFEGAKYAYLKNGIIVMLGNEWTFFERDIE